MVKPETLELLKTKAPVIDYTIARELYEDIAFPALRDWKGNGLIFEKLLVPPPPPRQEGDPLPVRDRNTRTTYPLWVIREFARKKLGIYPEDTHVLATLATTHPWLCAHVSLKDASRVAYTPDSSSGDRDIQVVISIEKLLGRVYPYLPDHEIAIIAADHKAEMDSTIETITGDELVAVYDKAEGVAACMSKPLTEYSYPVRPTIAYKADNISMAVTRNSLTGEVTARAMLYCPTPEDKRYIRVYGSETLKRKLERSGYVAGTWHGAKFNTVKVDSNRYALPYLDGLGAMANGAQTSAVVLFDGVLTSVTYDTYTKVRNRLGVDYAVQATSTSGYCKLLNIDTASLTKTCAVSGETFNELDTEATDVWVNGAKGYAIASKVSHWSGANVVLNGVVCRVAISDTESTFSYRYDLWVDNTDAREYCRMVKLSEKYYGAVNQGWLSQTDLVKTSEGWIRQEDSITVINSSLSAEFWHKSLYDKKLHILVHNSNRSVNRKLYSVNTNEIVKIVGSTRAVVGYHNIVKDIHGVWQWTRLVSTRSYMGKPYFGTSFRELEDYIKELRIAYVCKNFNLGSLVEMLNELGWYPRKTDGTRYCTTSKGKLDQLRQYCWLNCEGETKEVFKRYDMMLVEANAVDYNLVAEAAPLPIGDQNGQTS